MADPANVNAIDDIALVTGYEVRPVVASPDDIAGLLSRLTRLDDVVTSAESDEDGEQRGRGRRPARDGRRRAGHQARQPDHRPGGRARRLGRAPGARRTRHARPLPRRRHAQRGHDHPAAHGQRRGVAHQDHVRPGHRRAAPAAGRPRRAGDRRARGRPARRDAPQRARRGRRDAHPGQGERDPRAGQARDGRARAHALRARDPPVLRRGPRHRPDRLGQVDVALRGAGPDQHAREEHHHHRGPGRAPGRRHHAGPDQPQGGAGLRHGPALDDARRPRRDHGRRDPRPPDGADRGRGGAHGPPRALHAAHERRADRRHATDGDGDRAVPGLERDRLRRRPAPRPPALPAVQEAHDHPRGRPAPELVPRDGRPRGLRGRRAARAAAAVATRAGSASTR